tara:strand:- start:173 stop:592 length:420 start_codon:yes stop_codon:yes gene_type:complete
MRIVLDTNLHISGLIRKIGTPADILRLWRNGKFEIAISKEIAKEIFDVLNRPHIKDKYSLDNEDIFSYMNLLKKQAFLVNGGLKLDVVKDDPDDNMILECAVESKADFIVSGDKHLLNLREYEGISILNAGEFLKKING